MPRSSMPKARASPTRKRRSTKSYDAGVTDEFVLPCAIGDYAGVRDGDALLFANFRPDRAREISTALLDPEFDGFARARVARFSAAAGMTEYSEALKKFMTALFPAEEITDTLGELFAERGLKQLRIAETEKYPHVTFFMNGGRETQFAGEDRILVPSPKVATYDLKPEMSADEVTDKLVEAIGSGKYDLIIVNYANPDMVGHTGVMKAAVEAVETIDKCLGRLREAVEERGRGAACHRRSWQYRADAGSGDRRTAHRAHAPRCADHRGERRYRQHRVLRNGRLADVAPTLLDLLGMAKPPQMTGQSLVEPEYRMQKTEAGS